MINIENEQTQLIITEYINNIINNAINIIIKKENFKNNFEVNVILVDNTEIKKINYEYRKINKSTDVLSFPILDMKNGLLEKSIIGDKDLDQDELLLGDIVISLEKVSEQANIYNHSFERELAFLVTHGMYHLLGYDHQDDVSEKNMFKKQEAVLELMNLKRI